MRTKHPRWSGAAIQLGILLALVVLLPGCNRIPSAAQRLSQASETIALRIGSTSDEVANSFRLTLRGRTDDEIALRAEEAVQRSAWLDDLLARIGEERLATARAVHGATCDLIDIVSAVTPEEQADALYSSIVGHLEDEGLPATREKIEEITDGIETQLDSLERSGTLDLDDLAVDLACVLS